MNATLTHVFKGASAATLLPIFADVEAYPSFVPGFRSAEVFERTEGEYKTKAVMALQVGPFTFEEQLSAVTKVLANSIEVQSFGTRFIRSFCNVWYFRDLPGGCIVDFAMAIDFAMLPPLVQPMLAGLAQRHAEKILGAFVARIEDMHLCSAPQGLVRDTPKPQRAPILGAELLAAVE